MNSEITSNIDGIYSVSYTGEIGNGFAIIVLSKGILVGADVGGGAYDGCYETKPDGSTICSATMTVPPGTWLVTGSNVINESYAMTFKAILPQEFLAPNVVPLDLPTGRVNAFFRLLRRLSNDVGT